MMFRRFVHIALFCILCVLRVSAQGILTFTSDQGLTNTCIHSISEDSYHNVWITTRNGLNMYDGAKMCNYYHQEKDSTSLIDNIVTCVQELTPGLLLVGTNAGLCSYDYATDRFCAVPLVNENGDARPIRVFDIVKRKDGTVLVLGTGKACFILSKDDEGVNVKCTMDYCYDDQGISYYLEARDGKEWVVTKDSRVVFFQNGKAHPVAFDGLARHLAEGVKGNIYLKGDEQGFYRFSPVSNSFDPLEFPELQHAIIKKVRSNGEGKIMICTDGNGLFLYNEKTGELEASPVRTTEYSIAQANIEDAMQDKMGNLWIGVYWKGVVVQPHVSSSFEYVGRRSGLKNTLGTNCVTSILPAEDGCLWVGTDHCGLYHLSPDGTQSIHYKPGEVPHVPGTITALHRDKRGMLWMGSSLGGLVCMNPQNKAFVPFENICPEGGAIKMVFSIAEDNYGNLWFATMGDGVYCYHADSKQIKHFKEIGQKVTAGEYALLGNRWTNKIVVDGNFLYVGSASGIDCFNIKEDGMLEHGRHFLSCNICDIALDAQGVVWAATTTGLYRLVPGQEHAEITRFTQEDGLSNDLVRSLELYYLPSGGYEVWASTDDGLNCYSPATKAFRRFFIEDGLQGNEFTEHCSAHVNDRLVFGGINGLNYFVPNEVFRASSETVVRLRLVGLYVQGTEVVAGQESGGYTIYQSWIDEAKELHFCHTDNNIWLEVSTLEMFQNASYEYCVDGKDWVSLGDGQNMIVLNNLRVGQYTLRIRASVNGKQGEEKQVIIVIHAPWYASWWMKLVYTMLAVIIVYLLYRFARVRVRERQLMYERKQEEEMAEARIQFFMNISHEIRTPMTLILAPLEKLRNMNDDDEHKKSYNLIYQNAQRILQLINQMMDVRKIEKGQLQLDYQRVELIGFVKNLVDLFESSSRNRSITLEYLHSMDKLEVQVDISSMDKIIMNLLSNAFKFTSDNGKVVIEVREDPTAGTFTLSVTDDGIGISGMDKDRVFERFYSGVHQNGYIGTGIGLNLTYLLVKLHKGEIDVMDNPEGKGTRFVVTMPVCNPDRALDEASPESSVTVEDPAIDKSSGKRHRNLLLVEDDSDIRQYLHNELSTEFNIIECSNGHEAWEFVQRSPEKVDIIITDIMMPLMGGDELCQKVKDNFNTNRIPVILLSAKNTDADRIAGMNLGADAYMTKPFNVDLLRTTALTILQNHQSLQSRMASSQKAEESIQNVELVSPDEQLMNRIMKCINENLSNPDLSVEFVADTVGVSRVHFHRKLKELAGQTPREFIRSIRMKQAERLLREKHLDITDVSIAIGFKSLSTFSTTFKAIYGMTPTEYMNAKKQGNTPE